MPTPNTSSPGTPDEADSDSEVTSPPKPPWEAPAFEAFDTAAEVTDYAAREEAEWPSVFPLNASDV